MSEQLHAGELLPSQDEMAVELGVSRATLREAFNQLYMMGLVEIKHGVGTYVKRPDASDFFDKFSSLVIMNRRSAEELLQARSIIEPAVAALAAENATADEKKEILTVLEVMEKKHRQRPVFDYKSEDHKFHTLIAAASHNRLLTTVVIAIRELLPLTIDMAFTQSKRLVSGAMEYHRKIYEAINSGDGESAYKHMEAHLLTVRELHSKVFD
jgi:GntR family transcriptional repressor for pyruvate dehydrogenase complex